MKIDWQERERERERELIQYFFVIILFRTLSILQQCPGSLVNHNNHSMIIYYQILYKYDNKSCVINANRCLYKYLDASGSPKFTTPSLLLFDKLVALHPNS